MLHSRKWLILLIGLSAFGNASPCPSLSHALSDLYKGIAYRNFFGRKQPPYDPARGTPLDLTLAAQEIPVRIPTNRAAIAPDGHVVLDGDNAGPSLSGKILLSKNPKKDGPEERERYVVLVHGIGLRHQNLHWEANELLQAGYHVALFDLSHHGESDPHYLREELGGRIGGDVIQAFHHFDSDPALANARGSAYSQSVGAIAKIAAMPYIGGLSPRFIGNKARPEWKSVLLQAEIFNAGPTHSPAIAFAGFYDEKVLVPQGQTIWGRALFAPVLRLARPGFVRAAEDMLALPEWPLPQSSNWGVNHGVGVLLIGTEGDTVIPPAHQVEMLRRVGAENVETHFISSGGHLEAKKADPDMGQVMIEFLDRQYQELHPSEK